MSGRRLHHFRHDQSPPEQHAVTVNQSQRARRPGPAAAGQLFRGPGEWL